MSSHGKFTTQSFSPCVVMSATGGKHYVCPPAFDCEGLPHEYPPSHSLATSSPSLPPLASFLEIFLLTFEIPAQTACHGSVLRLQASIVPSSLRRSDT